MAYSVDRVARALKDFLNFSEDKATKAIVDSGVANENGEITQKAFEKGWATIEHGKKK